MRKGDLGSRYSILEGRCESAEGKNGSLGRQGKKTRL
jgi:hypothetical protein